MLTIDFEEYHKNGQLLNIESTLQFIRDKNGIPIGFTGIYHDITERKKIQQQLARNFEETQAILRNAPVGIFVFDHQFTITSCNTYFGQLLGFTPEKIVGQHIQQLLNPSILPHMANALKGKAETWECKLGFFRINKNAQYRSLLLPFRVNNSISLKVL
jgi:PAS domain-containing protein